MYKNVMRMSVFVFGLAEREQKTRLGESLL